MFTELTQTSLILPSYHHLSHLNIGVSWIFSILTATLQQTKLSAQTSLLPRDLSHRTAKQLFHCGREIQSSHRIISSSGREVQPPHCPTHSPRCPAGLQGLSLLLHWQVGFQERRAQGKVVEGALVLYIRGKLFAIRAPKHWTKEAGQSFPQEEFKSREDKCVQTGPTPPVQKDRDHPDDLSRGQYRRYFQ